MVLVAPKRVRGMTFSGGHGGFFQGFGYRRHSDRADHAGTWFLSQ
jgi:hypothetical protein